MVSLFRIAFLDVSWVDLADIALVGVLLYELYKHIKTTVASRILLGGLILYLVYVVVKALGMSVLTSILEQFMSVGVIALLILFQQEIRKFLLSLGKGTIFKNSGLFRALFGRRRAAREDSFALQPAIDAAKAMSLQHVGGLMVFARSSDLSFYVDTGDDLDAVLSKRLLLTIFQKNSPLHDGAVIIQNGRICAARCILPVTENPAVPAALGLRHRAALGISEATDAAVLTVSEETGQMSVSYGGRIETNLTAKEVRARLNFYLLDRESGAPAPQAKGFEAAEEMSLA